MTRALLGALDGNCCPGVKDIIADRFGLLIGRFGFVHGRSPSVESYVLGNWSAGCCCG